MKTWKFTIGFLAASIMANSQLAWAATDLSQKKEYNQFLKERVLSDSATMNSFYQKNNSYFDTVSKAWMESWLQNDGEDSIPTIDTQMIKDKNGQETLKLIISKGGATATVTMNSTDDDYFAINGQKFYYLEAMNLPTVVNRLAGSDSSYKSMAVEMNSNATPARTGKSDYLSIQQFMKLSAIKKVTYLQHWRGVIEAAQRVNYTRYGAQTETEEKNYVHLHPALASLMAWATSAPADGTSCLVAGTVSTYRSGSCKADPNETFNKMCATSGSGNVACNPLVYGMASPDKPFCLNSSDQPGFTQRATIMCNEKSPLNGTPNSKERNLSYQRILTTYLMGKGGSPVNFAKCFNPQSEIDPKCQEIFEPQLQEFAKLQAAADASCNVKTLPDQPDACASLKQRTLELNFFTEGLVAPPITVSADKKSKEQIECEKNAKNTWNKETKKCEKPAVAEKPAKESKCKNSKSLKCNPLLAIIGVAAIIGIAWLLLGRKKHKKTVPPVITPTTIPGVPTTMPPATLPPSEGGTGTSSGTNGGVRGAEGTQ